MMELSECRCLVRYESHLFDMSTSTLRQTSYLQGSILSSETKKTIV